MQWLLIFAVIAILVPNDYWVPPDELKWAAWALVGLLAVTIAGSLYEANRFSPKR